MAYGSNPAHEALWDRFLSDTRALPKTERARFQGRRVLITGAGGYLGSAAAQAIADAGAASLCLLDVVEHGLYRLQGELNRTRFAGRMEYVLGSINDEALLRELFTRYRPQTVIHAAALKHVPLLQHNSIAAATTNILGTRSVFAAASQFEAERCVLLSTDKAVDAVGIMGATKRIAEMLLLAEEVFKGGSVVRLCNVLGSSGSVAPLFARQIADGGCLTVTDREATRYFISRAVAVDCILYGASATQMIRLGVPREAERRSVLQLAEFLLHEAEQAPSRIAYTHLRPGERKHETLWSSDERVLAIEADSPLLPLSTSLPKRELLESALAEITRVLQCRNHTELTRWMATLVPSLSEVLA